MCASETSTFCDGKNKRTCAEVDAEICGTAAIFRCKANFMFNPERTRCVACSAEVNELFAKTCDGEKITSCQEGFSLTFDKLQCFNCSSADNA